MSAQDAIDRAERHRRTAAQLLLEQEEDSTAMAVVHALLAIEARLDELTYGISVNP